MKVWMDWTDVDSHYYLSYVVRSPGNTVRVREHKSNYVFQWGMRICVSWHATVRYMYIVVKLWLYDYIRCAYTGSKILDFIRCYPNIVRFMRALHCYSNLYCAINSKILSFSYFRNIWKCLILWWHVLAYCFIFLFIYFILTRNSSLVNFFVNKIKILIDNYRDNWDNYFSMEFILVIDRNIDTFMADRATCDPYLISEGINSSKAINDKSITVYLIVYVFNINFGDGSSFKINDIVVTIYNVINACRFGSKILFLRKLKVLGTFLAHIYSNWLLIFNAIY